MAAINDTTPIPMLAPDNWSPVLRQPLIPNHKKNAAVSSSPILSASISGT